MRNKGWKDLVRQMGLQNPESHVTTLIIPSIHWSLNIAIVSDDTMDSIMNQTLEGYWYEVRNMNFRMLFTHEDKRLASSRGVVISSWTLGDPQVSNTRVSYEYVEQYRCTFGRGYGSRPRSSCLDSVNSYRDKRFSRRVHPSPFINDGDIGSHQYYSSSKQGNCLLQMKLESILHCLTNDATFVAERANPFMVRVTDRLATKLIATTGQTLFAFINGLHVDSCDRINSNLRRILFPLPLESWQERILSFSHVSFPTTCGYQHVWKDNDQREDYEVIHHFVMPGLGIGVLLEDSTCHHFMGGSFSHCTGLCILQSRNDDVVVVNNKEDIFRIFAWGNSVNAKTAYGNLSMHNGLANHRARHEENRAVARGTVL